VGIPTFPERPEILNFEDIHNLFTQRLARSMVDPPLRLHRFSFQLLRTEPPRIESIMHWSRAA
jgi:hypothetical protein